MLSWPCQASGIIISTAWGSDRPAMTRNSSTLSKMAESLPPSSTMGRTFFRSREQRRLAQGLAGPHPVDVAPERVDLAVVGHVPVRVGQRPGGKRVGREALVDEGQRRLHGRVRHVGVHGLDLVGREHALVDERIGGEARQVEELPGRHVGTVDRVLHPLSDDVEPALEGPVVHEADAPPDENLPDDGLDRPGARPDGRVVRGDVPPAQEALAFLPDDLFKDGLAASRLRRIPGEEDQPCAVPAGGRQVDADAGAHTAEECVGHLDEDPCSVPRVDLATAGAPMEEVLQDGQGLGDDPVGLPALDVYHEPDAATVAFESGIIQPLPGRHPRNHQIIHVPHRYPPLPAPCVRCRRPSPPAGSGLFSPAHSPALLWWSRRSLPGRGSAGPGKNRAVPPPELRYSTSVSSISHAEIEIYFTLAMLMDILRGHES